MIERTIKFLKYDGERVKAKCKQGCGYTILCSKVANSETFEIKIIIHKFMLMEESSLTRMLSQNGF